MKAVCMHSPGLRSCKQVLGKFLESLTMKSLGQLQVKHVIQRLAYASDTGQEATTQAQTLTGRLCNGMHLAY